MRSTRLPLVWFPLAAFLCTASTQAFAQCAYDWHSIVSSPGTIGPVYATINWDPDGAGPLPPLLVVGGNFDIAGDVIGRGIAAYDPASGDWSAFGAGLGEEVRSLAVLPNGELVAGTADLQSPLGSGGVYRWNGTNWDNLGVYGGPVYALEIAANGDLLAGGTFTSAGGVNVRKIARWDGTNWSALGLGIGLGQVFETQIVLSIAELPNGDIVAGGNFTMAGGTQANSIAVWNGVNWSGFGLATNARVRALALLPNGELVAGGLITPIGGGGGARVARWNGSSWQPMQSLSNMVWALEVATNGDLFAGGLFTASGVAESRVARWNGTGWTAVGDGLGGLVTTITVLPSGDIVAAGDFTATAGAHNIARWNGTIWGSVSTGSFGLDDEVRTFEALPNGEFYVGGEFQTIGGTSFSHIAGSDGSTWFPLGSGTIGHVRSLTALPNGDLIVGGQFWAAGGINAPGIARWDGSSWYAMPGWQTDHALALLLLPNGNIVAGGLHAQLWDGQTWAPMGSGFIGIKALARMPNGDLVAGCTSQYGASIRWWNGTDWASVGTPLGGFVNAMAVMPNGDLIAGGSFTGSVARWNGVTWSVLGQGFSLGQVLALAVMPNGDLLAGRTYSGDIHRWDGVQWHTIPVPLFLGRIYALESLPNGDVLVGGGWSGSATIGYEAAFRLSTTCPATVTSFGTGCTGSGGLNQLSARSLPWVGGTFTAEATGMPLISLAMSVHGFQSMSLPLSAILPQGVLGCELLVTPDILDVYLPDAGRVTVAVPIPNDPSLVGQVHNLQVAPLGANSQLEFVEFTSTNALAFTIGALGN